MPPVRVNPSALSSQTRFALRALKAALAEEPGVSHVQVTFDNVKASDVPPTVDVVWDI